MVKNQNQNTKRREYPRVLIHSLVNLGSLQSTSASFRPKTCKKPPLAVLRVVPFFNLSVYLHHHHFVVLTLSKACWYHCQACLLPLENRTLQSTPPPLSRDRARKTKRTFSGTMRCLLDVMQDLACSGPWSPSCNNSSSLNKDVGSRGQGIVVDRRRRKTMENTLLLSSLPGDERRSPRYQTNCTGRRPESHVVVC